MRSLLVLLPLLVACWLPPPPPPSLLPDGEATPADIRTACTMTATKCSRCHSLDRVLVAKVSSPTQWESYVRRMRRQSGSGITEGDATVILRCLTYRSFGPPGGTP